MLLQAIAQERLQLTRARRRNDNPGDYRARVRSRAIVLVRLAKLDHELALVVAHAKEIGVYRRY